MEFQTRKGCQLGSEIAKTSAFTVNRVAVLDQGHTTTLKFN